MNPQDAAAHQVMLQFMKDHCGNHPPLSYLEIGVREGDSLRAVLDSSPAIERVVCADNWGGSYGGTGRGGHGHIEEIVSRYGSGVQSLRFLDGDSKETVPTLAGQRFDLILVDGDHSWDGAAADLRNVSSLVGPGGFVLFHDIAHPLHLYLDSLFDLWCSHYAEEIDRCFKSLEGYGFGVARFK